MFEEIKKVLNNFEIVLEKCYNWEVLLKEDKEILDYFELDMARALMKIDLKDFAEKTAKIILAHKGLLNEIRINVE